MHVTNEERLEILKKYGEVDIHINEHDGSFRVRFIGSQNFNKFGWSYADRDSAIRGLYDALQGSLCFSCVSPGCDMDFDYDYPPSTKS